MKLRRILAVCALVIVCFVSLATPALAYGGYYEYEVDEFASYVNPYSFEISCISWDDNSYNRSVTVDSSYGVFPDLDSSITGYPPSSYDFSREGYNFNVSPELLYIETSEIYAPVITYSNFYADLSITNSYDSGLAPFPSLYLSCLNYGDFLQSYSPNLYCDVYYYFFDESTGKLQKMNQLIFWHPSIFSGDILAYDLNNVFDSFTPPNLDFPVVFVESVNFGFEDNYMINGEYIFDMELSMPLSDDTEDFSYNQTVVDFCPELNVTVEETIIVEEVIEEVVVEEVVTFDSFDFTEWLYTSVSSVLNLQIIPGVPLYLIVGSILGVSLLFAFLRFFT